MLVLLSTIPLCLYVIYYLFIGLVFKMPSIDGLISCSTIIVPLLLIDIIPIAIAAIIPFLIKKIIPSIKQLRKLHKKEVVSALCISFVADLVLLTIYFLPSLFNMYHASIYSDITNALNRIQFEILIECLFINAAILYIILVEKKKRRRLHV